MHGMSPPEVAILHAPGTNRDRDLAAAFDLAGARATIHLVDAVVADPAPLRAAKIIAIPGGYSYGDALGAGRIMSLAIDTRLGDALREHLAAARLVLGICNGFQALLRSGLLTDDAATPPAALAPNSGGSFVCGWTSIIPSANSTSAAIAKLHRGQSQVDCPVAHGEGRFFAPDDATLDAFDRAGQVAFRYAPAPTAPSGWLGNPNGSARDIAGITNRRGTALGLMPHPENHVLARQHPGGTRASDRTSGLPFFQALLAQVG